ncbi:hypothetical protein LTR95_006769 [Oleoguttula sp. CCFEE 5521]
MEHIEWSEYRVDAAVSQPPPRSTFEATINWVFLVLAYYTESRICDYGYNETFGHKHCAKARLLCQTQIWKEFRIARSTSWTLEQICYIIDRVPEEQYTHCREIHKNAC